MISVYNDGFHNRKSPNDRMVSVYNDGFHNRKYLYGMMVSALMKLRDSQNDGSLWQDDKCLK
jgi:regulator of replication initiation timing